MEYSNDDPLSLYSDDIGVIDYTAQAVRVVALEIDETLNQLGWECITDIKCHAQRTLDHDAPAGAHQASENVTLLINVLQIRQG